MYSQAPILVFSDFPAEGEEIAQTIRNISNRAVRAAVDPIAALETLGVDRPEIVFAHVQAGAVAATGFLNEVWTRHPQTARFLVGDSTADSDALVRCALGPHQFIAGPVDPEKLDAALSRADAIKRFVRNEKIRELLSRMRTLPSRPALSIEIMRELRSENASARAVGELVSRDLAISTKLIQMANSAFYSASQQVSNPFEAVMLIGLEATAALVLSIETFAQLDKLKPLYFSIDRVWKHSQSVAELARKISQLIGCDAETSAHVYTAGLMHDIGKLAFAQNFEEDYERMLQDAEKTGVPVHRLEEEFFGASHAETGAHLLALWGLPLAIVEAVASHHCPADRMSKDAPAATALRLADQLVAAPPDKLKKILTEYPAELGLRSRLEQFKVLLGMSKVVPAKQGHSEGASALASENISTFVAPSEPVLKSNICRESPETRNTTQRARRAFYIAFAAVVAFVLFSYSFQLLPPLQAQAQLGSKPKHAAPKAEVAGDLDQSVQSEPLFPFDQLFPTEELPVPEYVPDFNHDSTSSDL